MRGTEVVPRRSRTHPNRRTTRDRWRYTQSVALSIPAVQRALKEDALDAWLLYDFHGSNPIARRIAGLDDGSKMTTRRWFYVIPASGEPRKLVHAIEPHNLDHLPGGKTTYSQRETLVSGLRNVLGGLKRVAMEYFPGNAIPYISRVDAGTIETVQGLDIAVASSGDLVQRFEAVWSDEAYASHRAASERLYRIQAGRSTWSVAHGRPGEWSPSWTCSGR